MDYQTLFRSSGRWCLVPLSTLSIAGWLTAQTTVDLHNQARNVDFSNASATRVWKTGSVLPAQCNTGEGFFLLTAAPGQNLYLCTASGTWNQTSSPIAGTGSEVQSVSGTFVPGAVPSIDATGTETPSGCTASSGQLTCSGGVNSGYGPTRITGTEGSAPTAPSTGLQTLYLDSADHNFKSIDGSAEIRQYATTSGQETLSAKTLVNPSLGGTSLTMSVPNETSHGTLLNRLAKLTGTISSAITTSVSDVAGVIGVVVRGAGISGNAEVATAGQALCVFDGGTAAGDYVTVSSVVAGACHDAGSNYPAGAQILGRALNTTSGAGSSFMELFGTEVHGSTAAPAASFDPLDETVAWWRDEMTYNTQWYVYTSSGGGLSVASNVDVFHPGIFELQTSGANSSSVSILLAWNNGAQVMHYPGGLTWDMRWVVQLGSLTGANYTFGFTDSRGQNSLFLSYQPSMGADWFGISTNSGVSTSVDLGVTASTSSWAKLRMRSDGSNIYFSVNGDTEQTICASGCTAAATVGLNGATGVTPVATITAGVPATESLAVDFFGLQFSGLTR